MKLYLAGPMRGYLQSNFPMFDKVTARLRKRGHAVFSPAERDRQDGFDPTASDFSIEEHPIRSIAYYMAIDLPEVCKADAVALLPGWEQSEGANIEVAVGRAVGKRILYADTLTDVTGPMPSIQRLGLNDYLPKLATPSPAMIIDAAVIKAAELDARRLGIGGAPTRETTLPEDAAARKTFPVASGFLDYFPDAVLAVAHVSWKGNQQHNPGKPLFWDRSKSSDESDAMIRHFLRRGTMDNDGLRHSAKLAWRALASLQKEIEAEAR